MKPFSIQCDSCQAKLKVTKPSAIGQILACPKCASLVQVNPPSDWEDGDEQSPAGDEVTTQASDVKPAAPSKPPVNAPSESPESDSARELLPSDKWTSAESRARRKLLTLFGVVGIGVIVAVTAIGYIATRLGQGGSSIADTGLDSPASPDQPATDTPSGDEPNEDRTPQITPDADQRLLENDGSPNDPNGTVTGDSDTTGSDPDTVPPMISSDPPTTTTDGVPDSDVVDDPPAFETPLETGGESPNPFDVVLSDLNALGAIMEESPFDKARLLAERELQVAYRVRIAPSEVFADRPKPRDYKIEDQLGWTLPEISIESTTLIEFVELVRNMTGIPITIEPEALAATGASLSQTMSVSGSNVTIADLLSSNLQTIGLGWYQDGEMVVISIADAKSLTTQNFELGDISASFDAEDQLLPQLIMAMIDPPSWAPGNETSIERQQDRLIVRQSPLNHYRLQQFLDRWESVLNDPSPESPKLVNRRDLARTLLESPVSLEHLQPVLLRQLVQEMSDQVEGEILVDWSRLAADGWTIDTTLTCSLLSLPLDLALDDALRPAGLGFRVINKDLIQITTMAAALGDPDIEFYSVRGLLDQNVSEAEFAERLPLVFRAVGTQEPGKRFFFDPKSGLLVAALPQPQQRAMARFLGSWIQFQARSEL